MKQGAAALVQLVEHLRKRNISRDRQILRDVLESDRAPKEGLRFVHTNPSAIFSQTPAGT
jgi:hypothetical protein